MSNKSGWVDLYGINELQTEIMEFVDWWVRAKKTPIPQKEIIDKMHKQGVKDFTTVNALKSLKKKGYIRLADPRAMGKPGNQTFYVQLRRVRR